MKSKSNKAPKFRGAIKLAKPSSKYKSKFEDKMAFLLTGLKADFSYEPKDKVLTYEIPASLHKYNPDWVIGNMVLETKGIWDTEDRKKILYVIAQHPEIDLRMVFENPKLPIYKGSKTTYADWCDKNKIKWGTIADVPKWLKNG